MKGLKKSRAVVPAPIPPSTFESTLFRTVIESLSHPFYIIDAHTHELLVCNSATHLFGDVSSVNTCYATHNRRQPCDGNEHICPLQQVKKLKRPVVVDHVHFAHDGSPRHFEIHAFPIFDAEDEVAQMIEYSIDVTERKVLEYEIRRSRDELELHVKQRTQELEAAVAALRLEIEKHHRAERARRKAEKVVKEQQAKIVHSDRLRALGQMAAGIAHELNQPLVGVRGLAEHLLLAQERGWQMTEAQLREKLALIIEQADRMSHIIDHARLFAKDAASPAHILVDVNEVVMSALAFVRAQMQVHEIELEAKLTEREATVCANPYSLEEILFNLLVNARDAIDEKPRIQKRLANRRILIQTDVKMNGDSHVALKVSDTGMGIKSASLKKVFDPFFTTKSIDRGTGLGLSICRTLVEQFNGTIHIDSTHGYGTTITVTFPYVKREANLE